MSLLRLARAQLCRPQRVAALASVCLGAACVAQPLPPDTPPPAVSAPLNDDIIYSSTAAASPEEARAFVDAVNAELKQAWAGAERAAWVKATYITHDTELIEAAAQEQVLEVLTRRVKEARRFEGLELPADVSRQLQLLRLAAGAPAPDDSKKRAELAQLQSRLSSIYGKGRYCSKTLAGHPLPKDVPAWKAKQAAAEDDGCKDLTELSKILAESRDPALLLEAWRGWRTVSREMRPLYQRFVELGNAGAKELGFSSMAEVWRARYDMSEQEFVADMQRLYEQLAPLYTKLHCYARAKLQKQYGAELVPDGKPIPAHLLGNMWAQEWTNLYSLLEPFPGKGQPDLTATLQKQGYDARKLVKLAESFFVSLGMDPLPETFWERSLFTKPADREVECHASAWDVDFSGDLRIKMCIQINHEDLVTIHHELGHNYYFHYYGQLPPLFQQGANDGFHEGVGDTLALAVTPKYLKQVGLLEQAIESDEADLNLLMQRALEGVAFLPFGYLIDRWRWDVFSGDTGPEQYNAAWWELRRQYQGVAPPAERSEQDFDPGAKYHIPANVPYIRYYIARILQYQLYRGLCRAAGHQGPLHRCTFHGNQAAGERLIAMLKLGASKPWPDALEAVTGERALDASAMLDYYAPLSAWLDQQNAGRQCGW